jgi:hypothetical protein
MLLAAMLFLFPYPQSGDAVKTMTERAAVVSEDTTKDASDSKPLPSTPEPKIKSDADVANEANAAAPGAGNAMPLAVKPSKPAFAPSYETERQKKLWYALTFAGSGAAAFDAWSTRRAISGGYGTESNPMLRPFVHSNAIYAATQVSPLVMDIIGRKMMTSKHEWMRRMWWVPQSGGTSFSTIAAVHNVTVVP